MGIFDILRGERRIPRADLDALFAVSTAESTLEINLGLEATGRGGVCFKPVEMASFAAVLDDIEQLVDLDLDTGAAARRVDDEFGFLWLVIDDESLTDLVVRIHAVNRVMVDAGFSSQLLCSVFAFEADDGPVLLVYSYKRGTFYPFVPRDGSRDTATELRLRASLAAELRMEPELERWFPVWGAPVLGA